MKTLLLRIAGIGVCFVIAMSGLIFVIHGIQSGIDPVIILACAICTIGGMVGIIWLTRRA